MQERVIRLAARAFAEAVSFVIGRNNDAVIRIVLKRLSGMKLKYTPSAIFSLIISDIIFITPFLFYIYMN